MTIDFGHYANSQGALFRSRSESRQSRALIYPFTHVVYPANFGFVLLNEGVSDEAAPGGISQSSDTHPCVGDSKSWRRGGEYIPISVVRDYANPCQTLVKRALERIIVRLHAQSSPPDDASLASETLRVLRDAQSPFLFFFVSQSVDSDAHKGEKQSRSHRRTWCRQDVYHRGTRPTRSRS